MKDVIYRFGLTVDYVNKVLTLFLTVGFRFVNHSPPWPSHPNRERCCSSFYKMNRGDLEDALTFGFNCLWRQNCIPGSNLLSYHPLADHGLSSRASRRVITAIPLKGIFLGILDPFLRLW